MPLGRYQVRRLAWRKPGYKKYPHKARRTYVGRHRFDALTTGGFRPVKGEFKVNNWFPRGVGQKSLPNNYHQLCFPDREYFHFKSTAYVAFNGTTGGAIGTPVTIGLNDLYNNFSSGWNARTQPNGWVETYNRYKFFRVTKCIVKLRILNAATVTSTLIIMPQNSQDTSNYVFPVENCIATLDKPGVDYEIGSIQMGVSGTTVNTAGVETSRVKTYDIASFEGLSRLQFNVQQDDYTCTAGASPIRRAVLNLGVGSFAGDNNSGWTVIAEVIQCGVAWERRSQTG